MTMSISHNKPWLANAANSLRERVLRGRAAAQEARARRAKYRQTVNELSALSDRDLADIGISRADITRIALDELRGVRP